MWEQKATVVADMLRGNVLNRGDTKNQLQIIPQKPIKKGGWKNGLRVHKTGIHSRGA